jgi:hypothetical protein
MSNAGADNFIGWPMIKKLAWLEGLQEARMTGQKTKVQTSPGVITEYNISQTDVTNSLRELEASIANDENFDPNDPTQAACAKNDRPSSTRINFGGGFNGGRSW